MNRRDVHFSLQDAALRKDVSLLGSLVGEVIEEQGGTELFHLVESVRLASLHRRQGASDAAEEQLRLVEATTARDVAARSVCGSHELAAGGFATTMARVGSGR